MSNLNLPGATNDFHDVRLVSLCGWQKANQITLRDHGCVVLQENGDRQGMKTIPTDFLIDRSGECLPLAHFYKLQAAEGRIEFIFGTAGEGR
jgi:hypothetical protein